MRHDEIRIFLSRFAGEDIRAEGGKLPSAQRGVGLLELLLALAISFALVLMSIRSYEGYRHRADIAIVGETVAAIQMAANNYYLSNCASGASQLQLSTWQSVSVLAEDLPQLANLNNPLGGPFPTGEYYQIQYMQIPNTTNIALCVQANLWKGYPAEKYYRVLNAITYSGATLATGIFCSASGENAVVWQSLPTLPTASYPNPQVYEALKHYRDENQTTSSLCPI
ncbi:MAG: hypothetical protein HY939_03470 [Gammaproteobacteria bacterium]|nr:hypothetical protein [Gammaproteobacteria bacterium]